MADNSIIKFDNNMFEAMSVEEIHALLLKKISDIYKVNVSSNSWTADSIYQKIHATWLKDFADVSEQTYNMLNIDVAEGSRLDQLVSILGIRRRGNRVSRIKCSVDYESLTQLNNVVGNWAYDVRRETLYKKESSSWYPSSLPTVEPVAPELNDMYFDVLNYEIKKYDGTNWILEASITGNALFFSDEVTIPATGILEFQDAAGRTWYLIEGDNTLQQIPKTGNIRLLDEHVYVCGEYGTLDVNSIGSEFSIGAINNYASTTNNVSYLDAYSYSISNLSVISRGSAEETDAQLRDRFKNMDITGLSSNTMSESMKAVLLEQYRFLSDVLVYANVSAQDEDIEQDKIVGTQSVTTLINGGSTLSLLRHNVIVLLKVQVGNNPTPTSYDLVIDTVIKKLPLGIGTENDISWATAIGATKWKSLEYKPIPTAPNIKIPYSIIVASPVSPEITITLDTNLTGSALAEAKTRIKDHLYNYSLSFKIGQPIILDDIRYQVLLSNININNPVYRVSDISISGGVSTYDTYFRYWLLHKGDIVWGDEL